MKKQLRCCVDSDGQEEYGEDKRSPVPSIYPQTVSHQIIVSGLIEKTLGLEGEGFQMRYGQRLASVAQVRPMTSELIKEELRRKKVTKKSSSPSPSPMPLPLHDMRDGLA